MRIFKGWNKFEIGLLFANILIAVYFLVAGQDYGWLPWLSFIASVSNTLCVILTAKKKVINFAWGILGVVTYGIVAYAYANTGEWMLNFLYYFPTNIIAWIAWYKNSTDKINVKPRYLTTKQIILTVAITVAGILAYAKFISLESLQIFFYGSVTGFGFNKYLIDSFTTISSIVAMILLIKQYQEQWLIWIAVDFFSIILWIYTFEPTMILLWATMLANATYGYIKWGKGKVLASV